MGVSQVDSAHGFLFLKEVVSKGGDLNWELVDQHLTFCSTHKKEVCNMPRQPNTTTTGGSFNQSSIDAVWRKSQVVPGYDPNWYRKDRCGAWIGKSSYGTTSQYGWEIDHIRPVARVGTDDFGNLQPLHWRNNRGKGDDYPQWYCSVPV